MSHRTHRTDARSKRRDQACLGYALQGGGRHPVEYIKEDLKIQEPGVELLRKCMGSVCEDYLTFDILKAYLADEEEDLFWSQGAVEMIEKIGAQNWLIMQM